jgi:predicted amidohydrolase
MTERCAAESVTTLAAVAMHCSHCYADNLRKYREFIEQAAQADVDLLVFPEVSLHGYLMGSAKAQGSKEYAEQLAYFRSVAEPIPGPSTELLQEYAAKHQMLIQAGLAERAMDGAVLYNSAVLVGPTGLLGVFRKVHNQFEWPVFRPGRQLRAVPTPLGKVGMLICYDLAFPEVIRSYALQGAIIASLTTAWPMKGEDPDDDPAARFYDLQSRANAQANQIWVVSANQVFRPPTEGCANYFGHSRIIAPTGDIVAEVGYEEGLAMASVELRQGIEHARTAHAFGNNLLADRKPELYGLLADTDIYFKSTV